MQAVNLTLEEAGDGHAPYSGANAGSLVVADPCPAAGQLKLPET